MNCIIYCLDEENTTISMNKAGSNIEFTIRGNAETTILLNIADMTDSYGANIDQVNFANQFITQFNIGATLLDALNANHDELNLATIWGLIQVRNLNGWRW